MSTYFSTRHGDRSKHHYDIKNQKLHTLVSKWIMTKNIEIMIFSQ